MRNGPARARFADHRSTLVGGVTVGALILFAALGPLAASHSPFESDFVHGLTPQGLPVGPCRVFPLGADRLFRDVFARLAQAGRLSLLIALGSAAMATVLGAAVGIVAGWCADRPPRV
ncbi:MAG: peptide ABC transporter permease, partial [Myxococcota bacterium]|nr:peptide ABC transporter permease [Myxococcota bacterium]